MSRVIIQYLRINDLLTSNCNCLRAGSNESMIMFDNLYPSIFTHQTLQSKHIDNHYNTAPETWTRIESTIDRKIHSHKLRSGRI